MSGIDNVDFKSLITSTVQYKMYRSKDQSCTYIVVEKSHYESYCRNIKILGSLKKYKKKPSGFMSLHIVENDRDIHLYRMNEKVQMTIFQDEGNGCRINRGTLQLQHYTFIGIKLFQKLMQMSLFLHLNGLQSNVRHLNQIFIDESGEFMLLDLQSTSKYKSEDNNNALRQLVQIVLEYMSKSDDLQEVEQNIKNIIEGNIDIDLDKHNYQIMGQILDMIFSNQNFNVMQIFNDLKTTQERQFFSSSEDILYWLGESHNSKFNQYKIDQCKLYSEVGKMIFTCEKHLKKKKIVSLSQQQQMKDKQSQQISEQTQQISELSKQNKILVESLQKKDQLISEQSDQIVRLQAQLHHYKQQLESTFDQNDSDNIQFYGQKDQQGYYHGRGKLLYPFKDQKQYYDGDFNQNMFDGLGKLKYKNGHYYMGQWVDNMKNGIGYYQTDQFEYLGQFQDNKLIGKAIFTCKSSNNHHNESESDETPFEQTNYIGELKNKQKQGKGMSFQQSNISYVGEYQSDMKHGLGYHLQQQDMYIGKFNNDQFLYGIYKNTQTIYIGGFVNGVKQGNGFSYDISKNKVNVGIWKDDQLVQLIHSRDNIYL